MQSGQIYHFNIGTKEKKKSIFILRHLNFFGYKLYSLNALIDTGAKISSCRLNTILIKKWVFIKYLILIIGNDGYETKINLKAKKVSLWLNSKKFIILKIMCFPNMHSDNFVGNNLLSQCYLIRINHDQIELT